MLPMQRGNCAVEIAFSSFVFLRLLMYSAYEGISLEPPIVEIYHNALNDVVFRVHNIKINHV